MKIAIIAFAVAAVALPTAPATEAKQPTAKRQDSLLEAIPINIGTSLKRPNGDVVGILKSRQAIALSEFLNLEDLQRRTDDAAAFDKGQAKGHATGDLSMRKRDRKELDDLTIDEIQSAAQGAMEDKPVTVGMPLEGRAEHALNEMTADEIQGAAQGVVDEKPVSIGAPLSRRTSHELNELTFEEAENTSERVVADRPVTVGMPEEQRDGLTSEAEHLTKTPAPDLNMPAPFG